MNSEEREQEKFEAWVQHVMAVAKEGDRTPEPNSIGLADADAEFGEIGMTIFSPETVKALIRESLSNYQSGPFWVLPVTYGPTLPKGVRLDAVCLGSFHALVHEAHTWLSSSSGRCYLSEKEKDLILRMSSAYDATYDGPASRHMLERTEALYDNVLTYAREVQDLSRRVIEAPRAFRAFMDAVCAYMDLRYRYRPVFVQVLRDVPIAAEAADILKHHRYAIIKESL